MLYSVYFFECRNGHCGRYLIWEERDEYLIHTKVDEADNVYKYWAIIVVSRTTTVDLHLLRILNYTIPVLTFNKTINRKVKRGKILLVNTTLILINAASDEYKISTPFVIGLRFLFYFSSIKIFRSNSILRHYGYNLYI